MNDFLDRSLLVASILNQLLLEKKHFARFQSSETDFLFLTAKTSSILVNVLCALAKNVYSAVIGYSVL